MIMILILRLVLEVAGGIYAKTKKVLPLPKQSVGHIVAGDYLLNPDFFDLLFSILDFIRCSSGSCTASSL